MGPLVAPLGASSRGFDKRSDRALSLAVAQRAGCLGREKAMGSNPGAANYFANGTLYGRPKKKKSKDRERRRGTRKKKRKKRRKEETEKRRIDGRRVEQPHVLIENEAGVRR